MNSYMKFPRNFAIDKVPRNFAKVPRSMSN